MGGKVFEIGFFADDPHWISTRSAPMPISSLRCLAAASSAGARICRRQSSSAAGPGSR
jgi:hypothetical protein